MNLYICDVLGTTTHGRLKLHVYRASIYKGWLSLEPGDQLRQWRSPDVPAEEFGGVEVDLETTLSRSTSVSVCLVLVFYK